MNMSDTSAKPAGPKSEQKKPESPVAAELKQGARLTTSLPQARPPLPQEKKTAVAKAVQSKGATEKKPTAAISKEDAINEQLELGRVNRTIRRLTRQSVWIAALTCLLALGAPFFAPIYIYHFITPEGKSALMVPLELPNLTNPSIVSWAATSATEIFSFGFGDVEEKAVLQKKRFTGPAWKAFVKAFMNNKIMETFRQSQMIMTTVPSNTPSIVSQGVNEEGAYEWKVEVPIITTYAANNNVVKPERGTLRMTIVRVPYDENPAGIAIDALRQIKN